MEDRFEEVELNNDLVKEKLGVVRSDLEGLRSDLDEVGAGISGVLGSFGGLEFRSAEQIVNPVITEVETVTPEVGQESLLYPYLLILVIMFISILLPSMLVVMEKTSRASFRNFTTPTREGYMVLMTFITTTVLLFVQTVFVLFLSYVLGVLPVSFLLDGDVFVTASVVMVLSIVLFSLVGMLIGLLSTTSEGATIASISVGSVLLFLSNVVTPVERLNVVVEYNPYVLLSEGLKKSLLFGTDLGGLGLMLAVVLPLILVLGGGVMFVKQMIRRRFFLRRNTGFLRVQKGQAVPLRVGDRLATDVSSLARAVQELTQGEYEELTQGKVNLIAQWVRKELGDARLARRLEGIPKEKMISLLSSLARK
ncbi:MAG: ABC transporter permease [Nitrosarchaeum sp.]|nr:ABC transporter permease [Nitrosarchaeum sp.]